MSSTFVCSKPFLHDLISFLPSPAALHPAIRLKPSPFTPFFSFPAALSTQKLHAAKLLDKFSQTDCSDENAVTGFSSSDHGRGEENGNLKKSVGYSKGMKPEKKSLKETRDALGALSLYEEAAKKGLRLHLCTSASTGFVYYEKSRSCGGDCGSEGFEAQASVAQREWMPRTVKSSGGVPVRLCDGGRGYAGRRGIEIYEQMSLQELPMSEAAMAFSTPMAMSTGDGDMAFSSCGSVENVFEAKKHIMELGITPEEHELEALLRVSVEVGRGEKVYCLLHKLRTIVRKVSPSTADAIDAWFRSSTAVRVGKRKWDSQAVRQAMENGGGGWHGLGWLGKGKWNVVRTRVDGEGACLCCGEKLVSVDLDPVETESFAECVESIVIKKERNSNFEKFQKWLEYYGPFEAVIDAANVGLFNQRRFSLNKVNAVANGIRQKLPSKKWPLIIIHNKRLFGGKMNEPCNRKLIEKWKNADAIYETPTGSNDDWYWLYAAIKCKCLVVTNDEMRDHVFQALGNDFFAKWKERHQVHFNHIDGSFQFIMPRPFSVVIQESESGHWHIPIAESEQGSNSSWMCVTRASFRVTSVASSYLFTDTPDDSATEITDLDAEASEQLCSSSSSKDSQKRTKNSSQISLPAIKSLKSQIVSAIEDAEKIGGCIIDFEI